LPKITRLSWERISLISREDELMAWNSWHALRHSA
jgi:hypothetical protein